MTSPAPHIVRPVRVLIAASHPLIRSVVKVACDALAVEVTTTPRTVAETREMLEHNGFDVVVLDAEMPDGDAVALLRDPVVADTRALVLSDREDGISVLDAIEAGAYGYVGKSDGFRGLTSVLREVVAGRRAITPDLERNATRDLRRFATRAQQHAEIRSALTRREREVLLYLLRGLTSRQIGRELGISARTVETCCTALYRKLGVRTRVQAASRAAALRLVPID